MVISLTKYERKTFWSFFGLYVGSVTILLGYIVVLFYGTNYQNTHANLIANMKIQAQSLSASLIMSDMKGVKKENLRLPSASADFTILYFFKDGVKNPLFLSLKNQNVWEDKVTKTIYYIDHSIQGHYGIEFIVLKDEVFLDEFKRYSHCAFLFGSIYIVVLIVGYLLARIFIKPIVLQREQLNNFIRDTTHELNTPISAIIMLINGENGIVNSKNLERIKYSVKRISEIYSDLTYVFLENKKGQISTIVESVCDTKKLLELQLEHFAQMAQSKNIELYVDLTENFLLIAKEDWIRLANNLISNALKYTPKNGKVEIVLNNEMFMVRDNGIGIAEQYQERIFDRFFRSSHDVGGFGIGLSIVKNICEKYHFVLQLDSQLARGSQFTIHFQ